MMYSHDGSKKGWIAELSAPHYCSYRDTGINSHDFGLGKDVYCPVLLLSEQQLVG